MSPAVRERVWSGLVLGLLAGCASTRPAPTPDAVRSEVVEAERGWWHAVSRGDVDRALSRFSQDTVFEAPDGSQVRGRVGLGERLRRDQRDRIAVLGVPEHVHIDSPELVVVTGTGQWTESEPDGPRVTTVRYVDTWRWTGASWRLVSAVASPAQEDAASTALVREVLGAWSRGDWASLQPLLAPGFHARSKDGGGHGGELRRRFDAFHRLWTAARFDIEEQFSVGERIVTRLQATLTEAGTGRTVRYAGLDISRVVDGHLADHWDSWEELSAVGAPQRPTPEAPAQGAPAAPPGAPEASSSSGLPAG